MILLFGHDLGSIVNVGYDLSQIEGKVESRGERDAIIAVVEDRCSLTGSDVHVVSQQLVRAINWLLVRRNNEARSLHVQFHASEISLQDKSELNEYTIERIGYSETIRW